MRDDGGSHLVLSGACKPMQVDYRSATCRLDTVAACERQSVAYQRDGMDRRNAARPR